MSSRVLPVTLVLLGLFFLYLTHSYNHAYAQASNAACEQICGVEHTEECPHTKGLPLEIYLGYTFSVLLFGYGIKLYFSKPSNKNFEEVLSKVSGDEKRLVKVLVDKGGAAFQSELVEATGFSKAKVSRLLDKLEAGGVVERRRRGMSNLVIIKARS